MRVVGRDQLVACWERHTDAHKALLAWLHEAQSAVWRVPADIKRRYPSASFLPGNRVVFNIKGNRYRLVVVVVYQGETVIIRFAGTHGEYDGVDAGSV